MEGMKSDVSTHRYYCSSYSWPYYRPLAGYRATDHRLVFIFFPLAIGFRSLILLLSEILSYSIRHLITNNQSVILMKPLPRSFYNRDTAIVAKELLGKTFVCRLADKPIYGRIVETEAYQSDDEACHAHKGKSARNQALFGPVGHTYVYLCYGIHFCMNIVARNTDKLPAGGVLIRGIAVSEGQVELRRIDGPGRTAKALSITIDHIGIDVTRGSSELVVYEEEPLAETDIIVTKRIGLSKGANKPWRFLCTL